MNQIALQKYAKVAVIIAFTFIIGCLAIACQPQIKVENTASANTETGQINVNSNIVNNLSNGEIPPAYKTNCAECHGDKGQGIKAAPELVGLTTRDEDRRSDQDLIGILNNPKAFGLSSKMKSYKDILSEREKQEIVQWIKSLK